MTTAKDIKRRIDSIGNVRQITRTMKAVASAKLSRAQDRIERSRAFARGIEQSIQEVLSRHSEITHELFQAKNVSSPLKDEDDTNPAYVVVSGDRGLYGAYNKNIFDYTEDILDEDEKARLYVVGKRGAKYFTRHDAPVDETWIDFMEDLEYEESFEITDRVVEDYLETDITSVTVIYNEFESAMVQNVREYPLLPMDREDFYGHSETQPKIDFLYEPDPQTVIDDLFPRHVRTQLYTALLEAYAAVQGARMVAMDNATENANEMIDDLTLEYNQARQSSITREIADITGGAEALKE